MIKSFKELWRYRPKKNCDAILPIEKPRPTRPQPGFVEKLGNALNLRSLQASSSYRIAAEKKFNSIKYRKLFQKP